MRNAIINLTIKNLRESGLRFSIDTIARELKISKKTVYKYFDTKERLALAVYDKFYADAANEIAKIDKTQNDAVVKLLTIYCDSFFMIKNEIFNKYSLNASIQSYAVSEHEKLWEKIKFAFDENDCPVFKVIIDGTFEKLSESSIAPEKVINKLVNALC